MLCSKDPLLGSFGEQSSVYILFKEVTYRNHNFCFLIKEIKILKYEKCWILDLWWQLLGQIIKLINNLDF